MHKVFSMRCGVRVETHLWVEQAGEWTIAAAWLLADYIVLKAQSIVYRQTRQIL